MAASEFSAAIYLKQSASLGQDPGATMRVVDVADGVSVVVHLLHCVGVPDDYLGHQYLDFSSALQADFPALLPQLSGSEYGGRHGAWLGPLHQVWPSQSATNRAHGQPWVWPSRSATNRAHGQATAPSVCVSFDPEDGFTSVVISLRFLVDAFPGGISRLGLGCLILRGLILRTEPSPPGAIRTPSSTFGPSGIWWASCR